MQIFFPGQRIPYFTLIAFVEVRVSRPSRPREECASGGGDGSCFIQWMSEESLAAGARGSAIGGSILHGMAAGRHCPQRWSEGEAVKGLAAAFSSPGMADWFPKKRAARGD